MTKYRVGCDATVCFTVEAATEEEVITKANLLCEEAYDGLSVPTFENVDFRVYVDGGPTVLDIEEQAND